ncbi:MAG: ImmA/IrrE family metallo-endopeptidase [Synergistaceae bacterium]|nr:ImmA/IrrE family metallo-endopeptidase [Synergistaceae bacterium]
MENAADEDFGDFPTPPELIPEWARREGKEWQRLDEFDILAEAEAQTGLSLDIKYVDLPAGVWGVHLVRGERGRIFVNSLLPPIWRRFAIFHELYHLLYHSKGARFWSQTFVSMDSFENRADAFAWAALWPEWEENQYCDWTGADVL